MGCLPCHGLFSCEATVIMRDRDARVQRHCPQIACPLHRCVTTRRCGNAGNSWIEHDLGLCRTNGLFALPRLACVRSYGDHARLRCANAAALLSGARGCVHSCCQIRTCGGTGNCWIKHDRGLCRTHGLFALPRLAPVRSFGTCTR
jgi:hypothetical protein